MLQMNDNSLFFLEFWFSLFEICKWNKSTKWNFTRCMQKKTSPLQALDLLAAPTPTLINYQLDKAHHSADKGT